MTFTTGLKSPPRSDSTSIVIATLLLASTVAGRVVAQPSPSMAGNASAGVAGTVISLPGDTRVPASSRKGALVAAALAANGGAKGCANWNVLDTKASEPDFGLGSKVNMSKRPWRGVWRMEGCGRSETVHLRMFPEKTGVLVVPHWPLD
jgi:hypothetical protein